MQRFATINEIRRQLGSWRAAGERIAFVPTMGNLHDGHLTLVAEARKRAERVVVSIFVNPLQFGKGEDLDAYPRTPEQDATRLEAAGADLLFLPEECEIYPLGREGGTFVEVPGLSEILCGASRPGHFRGVATVVAKLFNIVQPDIALFGEKDYQQLAVLRTMVRDLNMPVTLVGIPTVREADGLAMSSRNGYLTSQERRQAPQLYQTLQGVAAAIAGGDSDFGTLQREAGERLQAAGFRADYVSIRRAEDLALPTAGDRRLIVLAAAYLGRTRLIDNLLITIE